jgi:hypothetical protein
MFNRRIRPAAMSINLPFYCRRTVRAASRISSIVTRRFGVATDQRCPTGSSIRP